MQSNHNQDIYCYISTSTYVYYALIQTLAQKEDIKGIVITYKKNKEICCRCSAFLFFHV